MVQPKFLHLGCCWFLRSVGGWGGGGGEGVVFSGFIYVHNISQLKQGFCYPLCIQAIADVRVFPVITPVSVGW